MRTATMVRPPAVQGMFYPGDPSTLRSEISRMLRDAGGKAVQGKVRGLVAPHAGYIYSGSTAARGYAQLQGESYDVVVIIAPSHQEYFDGVSVYSGDAYRTPLGQVPVHAHLRELLARHSKCVEVSERGHREEHALEVQLPFLQQVLSAFSVLPVVIGNQHRANCYELGHGLASVLREQEYLLVASTDLSHYHSASVANRLDSLVIDDIARFDYGGLMTDLEEGKAEACGGGPVVTMMVALHSLGVNQMQVLHHCNSGDITGDVDRVVGYLSAAAYA
jgi:AmmeMemoRadiSam system protein B